MMLVYQICKLWDFLVRTAPHSSGFTFVEFLMDIEDRTFPLPLRFRAVGRSENLGEGGHCVLQWGFTRTFPGNQDATLK